MSVEVAGITFDHHHYDPRGDVLYLTVGGYEGGWPEHGEATPEGHGIEYDEVGRVMALTLTNVKWYLERDGVLTITWPAGRVSADDLSTVLQAAA